MAVEITMPKLSQTAEEVRLVRWLVQEGDSVKKGDLLCEVENDKTTMEVESFAGGSVLRLFGEPDSMVTAGTVIAVLGEPGEKAPKTTEPKTTAQTAVQADTTSQTTLGTTVQTAVSRLGPLPQGVNATHLVQNIALKKGIDLSQVQGTGPGGRITKRDLEVSQTGLQAAATLPAPKPPRVASAVPPDLDAYTLSENQKMLGRNLQASKARIPHYYLKTNLRCDRLLDWRESNRLPDGSKVSINSILIYAVARALKRHPRLNAYYREDRLLLNQEINLGLAVSAGEDLYVPVVHNAGEKRIPEIDRELEWLIAKVQNGRVEPEDLSGGTFTVSNLGMFPVDEFTAIINPPQVAILAFGRIRKEIVVDKNGSMNIGSTCVVTGSFDHRVVNGARGAAFLAEIESIMEKEL